MLGLALPIFVAAQQHPTPSPVWAAPAAAANNGGVDSSAAARVERTTRVAGRPSEDYACGPTSYQVAYPAENRLTTAPFGGQGALGSGNPASPAFSRVIVSNGPAGVGLEYLSPNNGFATSDQRTADVYRFDRAGLHRNECNLPSTVIVRPETR
ncbi:MAG TPA: hypothetical protein VFS11_02305 [Gemmatimonadales bacterium]|nr:hypothetical protein [Gemmatimonadales bacterium]